MNSEEMRSLEECLVEIARLEDLVEQLTVFTTACVETGTSYMNAAEQWEWVARKYEEFCHSHQWLPTTDILIAQYYNLCNDSDEVVTDYQKQSTPAFEE